MKLSIVVPCYNEGGNIEPLYRRTLRAAEQTAGEDFELILVNDGSQDATWPAIRHLAERDRRVVAVNLSRNYGHQLALSAGLALSRGERVLAIDADLQDPPELLPEMMRLMDDGFDVVYGKRTARQGETFFKKSTAALFYRVLNKLVDIHIPLDTGDFRLMSRRVVATLNGMPESQRFVRGMVSWIGFRQTALAYQRDPRTAGTTHYPMRKMIRLALDAITGFSTRPLRIAALLGIMFAALGGLGIVWSLLSWWQHDTVPGWTSAMVVTLTLGGIQLLVLGIIGEYLGRLYIETKRRPLYLIEEICTRSELQTPGIKNSL